ncbi:hypothetical protein PANA5342_0814 [Pantoea ananatis LMG 5342]|nr:hypothetical protein PANA5342_0814 [Pantoea ananatis LMG 5342]
MIILTTFRNADPIYRFAYKEKRGGLFNESID